MKFGHCLIALLILSLNSCKNEPKVRLEIPFIYSDHIYVKCKLNNKVDGNFIFDTGFYGICLDSAFDHTNINYRSYVNRYQSGDFITRSLGFMLDKVSYDHVEKETMIEIIDCKNVVGRYSDGIVGWDIFKEDIIKIDYQGKKISMIEPANFDPGKGFEKFPIKFKDNLLFITASVSLKTGQKIEGDYWFDLGCPASIILTGNVFRQFKLDSILKDRDEYIVYNSTLYNDTTRGGIFRARSIKVGSFEIKEPLINYSTNKIGINSGLNGNSEFLGFIGNKFFENFEMYIDFKGQCLYLKPKQQLLEREPFVFFGFTTIDRTDIGKGRIVKALYTNSKAAEFGIRPGDAVTHLDGRAVETYTIGEYQVYDVKKEYDFTIKRGDSIFHFKVTPKEK